MSATRRRLRDPNRRTRSAGVMPPLNEIAHRLQVAGQGDCKVCGAPAAFVGVFIPDAPTQRVVLAPPGKIRTIAYMICEACTKDRANIQWIEDQIMADFEAVRGRPTLN